MLLRALWEMFRYDALYRLLGLRGVRRRMGAQRHGRTTAGTMHVCRAVNCMSSFYWKPLLCLQRSVVTARLLRAYGVQADVVIGYRANPFMSHAWVEVDGRVVNDSPVYQVRLQLLDRF
jgi:Transglutaminase-like superfamily